MTPTYTDDFQRVLEIVRNVLGKVDIKNPDIDVEGLCREIAILIAEDRGIDIYK